MHTLYLCYFGLREPLVQTQVLPYLKQLASDGIKISLLTFEPSLQHTWSSTEMEHWRHLLCAEGICWFILPYHKWPSLPATIYDIATGTLFASRLVRCYDIDVIHARGHVATAIGALTKQLSNGRLIFDIRGFMPEEYVDGGHWPKGGYLYRLTKAVESRLMNAADGFVVLTKKARQILFSNCIDTDHKGRPIEVIPCCVDLQRFKSVNQLSKEAAQKELGISGHHILVYVGALGTWYLTDELAKFIAVAHQQNANTFSMILTQSAPDTISKPLRNLGVKDGTYLIRQVSPDAIPKYLKAADIALSFIKPCYSKLASSPTKIAEYLASGLPVICNSGIGDLDEIIEGDRVGIVIRDFNRETYLQTLELAKTLLQDDQLSERCRTTARKRFDLEIGGDCYRRLYRRLIDRREHELSSYESQTSGSVPDM